MYAFVILKNIPYVSKALTNQVQKKGDLVR